MEKREVREKLLLEALNAYLFNEQKKKKLDHHEDVIQQERLKYVLECTIESTLRSNKVLRKAISLDMPTMDALQKAGFYNEFTTILEENEKVREPLLGLVLQSKEEFFSYLDYAAREKEKTAPLLEGLKNHEKVLEYAFENIQVRHDDKEKDIREIKSILALDLIDFSTWEYPNKYGEDTPVVYFSFSSLKFDLGALIYESESFQSAHPDFINRANQAILNKLLVRGNGELFKFCSLPHFIPNDLHAYLIEGRCRERIEQNNMTEEEYLALTNIIDNKIKQKEQAIRCDDTIDVYEKVSLLSDLENAKDALHPTDTPKQAVKKPNN